MNTRPFYLGLIFIAIIAILANYLGNTDFSHHYHISALIIAILLGMAIGNTIIRNFQHKWKKACYLRKARFFALALCCMVFASLLAILLMSD